MYRSLKLNLKLFLFYSETSVNGLFFLGLKIILSIKSPKMFPINAAVLPISIQSAAALNHLK